MIASTLFQPDIIVETTAICDRKCPGCYAPNVVSKERPSLLAQSRPELFISTTNLDATLTYLSVKHRDGIHSIAFRGGEPSLHPELPELMTLAKSFAPNIFLETHGRWITESDLKDSILQSCKQTGVTVKISFDSMHGLSPEHLRTMTQVLDSHGIQWLVAVTESGQVNFSKIAVKNPWIPESKWIFQDKAMNSEELMKPKLAAIRVDGSISSELTSFPTPQPMRNGFENSIKKIAISSILMAISSISTAAESPMKTVHLGLASNFSEPSSSSSNPYGDYFRSGVRLALHDSADRLKSKNLEIKLDEFDYGTTQLRVLEASKKAVASEVIGIIGYNFSSHALLAAPIHQAAGLPMITPSATADRIGKLGKFVHTACFDNSFMGQILAQVATNRLKAKKVAIVVAADCAYCQDLALAFEKAFQATGGQVSIRSEVLESDKDFTSTVTKLKQSSFDVILVPNQELNSARIISGILKSGISKPFLGGDGWGNVGTEFFSILGQQDLQGYSVSHWHPEVASKRSKQFIKSYTAAFNKIPNDTSVLAYDTTLLMIEALLKSKALTRIDLENALNSIHRFEGVTGKMIFRPASSPTKSLVLLSAHQTRLSVVDIIEPEKQITGELK